eukprot:4075366-Amphidinium_carterae.1
MVGSAVEVALASWTCVMARIETLLSCVRKGHSNSTAETKPKFSAMEAQGWHHRPAWKPRPVLLAARGTSLDM